MNMSTYRAQVYFWSHWCVNLRLRFKFDVIQLLTECTSESTFCEFLIISHVCIEINETQYNVRFK